MLALDAEGNTPRHHAGPPFDAEHQRRLFATLETAPDASLDYLRDLTRSADRLVEFFELFFCGRDAAQAAAAAAVGLVLDDPDGKKLAQLQEAGHFEGELRQVAIGGDLERATQLLELGVNPDAAAESLADWHPLQYAAQAGRTEMCTLLVQYGADVFETDRNGETAMMQAAYWGHAETSAELKRLERLEELSGRAGVLPSLAPDCVVLEKPPEQWSWDSKNSVSIICSAPEFSRCGDKVMVGLFLVCDGFNEHVKFGYDWGGSVTAEPSDKNPDRLVYDCCHSLACTIGTGAGQCRVRGKPVRGPVDWSNPKSVAGSQ